MRFMVDWAQEMGAEDNRPLAIAYARVLACKGHRVAMASVDEWSYDILTLGGEAEAAETSSGGAATSITIVEMRESELVTIKEARGLYPAMLLARCNAGACVTNTGFTQAARELPRLFARPGAPLTGPGVTVDLVDGDLLRTYLNDLDDAQREALWCCLYKL